ncbi:MAG: flavodoxin domain-containing protein [Candidatus Helarchaeota archaeon]|nr:flavodoxin domain-containing protein [Candidatus Helarchaeota archaeon]
MKAIIIYNTKSGNTEALGKKIKEMLESKGITSEIHRDKDIKKTPNIVESFDLLCVGSPCHMGGPAFFPFRGFLKNLAKLDLKNKKLLCFATSGDEEKWPITCDKIKKRLPQLEHLGNVGCVETSIETAVPEIDRILKTLK